MEFENVEQIKQALEQIKWERYSNGSYSHNDPLLEIQDKLREARNNQNLSVTLTHQEINLLLNATKKSIKKISNYNYGDLSNPEKQRNESLAPINDLFRVLTTASQVE